MIINIVFDWVLTGHVGLFFYARLTSIHTHASPSLFCSMAYFILAVPMRVCLGKHSCASSPFPTAILNGTFFLTLCNYKCTF